MIDEILHFLEDHSEMLLLTALEIKLLFLKFPSIA